MPIAATVARPYLFHMLRSDQKRIKFMLNLAFGEPAELNV